MASIRIASEQPRADGQAMIAQRFCLALEKGSDSMKRGEQIVGHVSRELSTATNVWHFPAEAWRVSDVSSMKSFA